MPKYNFPCPLYPDCSFCQETARIRGEPEPTAADSDISDINARPYQCVPLCRKAYTTRGSLHRHQETCSSWQKDFVCAVKRREARIQMEKARIYTRLRARRPLPADASTRTSVAHHHHRHSSLTQNWRTFEAAPAFPEAPTASTLALLLAQPQLPPSTAMAHRQPLELDWAAFEADLASPAASSSSLSPAPARYQLRDRPRHSTAIPAAPPSWATEQRLPAQHGVGELETEEYALAASDEQAPEIAIDVPTGAQTVSSPVSSADGEDSDDALDMDMDMDMFGARLHDLLSKIKACEPAQCTAAAEICAPSPIAGPDRDWAESGMAQTLPRPLLPSGDGEEDHALDMDMDMFGERLHDLLSKIKACDSEPAHRTAAAGISTPSPIAGPGDWAESGTAQTIPRPLSCESFFAGDASKGLDFDGFEPYDHRTEQLADMTARDGKVRGIPRPKGDFVKRAGGGQNVPEALGLTGKMGLEIYQSIRESARELAVAVHIDFSKVFRKQEEENVVQFCCLIERRHAILRACEKSWGARVILQHHITDWRRRHNAKIRPRLRFL
ncbi:hypothetical protein FA95DRAFT_255151 [Auriscalpium vulgare]|uniref:Uncharacterized protein n=1 Tax=Auriscalpium vulgare TaxID=40419 RepID=A0ACB8RLI7_9AGAM|nr:hypothetical protein FA95DRAFT_255151 [Auriscalpium vulgare]